MDIKEIGLKETIQALRQEISEAILVSEGKEIRFEAGEIELEFQVAIEKMKEGKGGIKFWVIGLDGGVANKNVTIHKIKIPLKPVWKDGSTVYTGDDEFAD